MHDRPCDQIQIQHQVGDLLYYSCSPTPPSKEARLGYIGYITRMTVWKTDTSYHTYYHVMWGDSDIDDKMYTAQDIKDFKVFLELELKREEEENVRTQSR